MHPPERTPRSMHSRCTADLQRNRTSENTSSPISDSDFDSIGPIKSRESVPIQNPNNFPSYVLCHIVLYSCDISERSCFKHRTKRPSSPGHPRLFELMVHMLWPRYQKLHMPTRSTCWSKGRKLTPSAVRLGATTRDLDWSAAEYS